MKSLNPHWIPSDKLKQSILEVDHNEETKYFKYFNIRNQVRRDDWDNEYKKWCARSKTRRLSTSTAKRTNTKQSNNTNSFFARVHAELRNK